MTMKRADWIFVVGVVVVILFFIALSKYGRRTPPPMPANPEHRAAETRMDCLQCHDPRQSEAVRPISARHPQAWMDERFRCTVCHQQTR